MNARQPPTDEDTNAGQQEANRPPADAPPAGRRSGHRPSAGRPAAERPPAERPPTAVPDGEEPAGRCPYCDRPLSSDRLLALHVGDAHPENCTAAERERHEEAHEAESDDLFLYHLKVVAGLGALWAAFILAYMVALGGSG